MSLKLPLIALLFFIISANAQMQTFTWDSSQAHQQSNAVVETVNGITATVTTNGATAPDLISAGGFQGSTGTVVTSGSNATSITVSFNTPVNIHTIYVFDAEINWAGYNWTFTPSGGGTTFSEPVSGLNNGVNLNVGNLSWTNITSFTITNNNPNGLEWYGLDNIVVSPYTPPCTVNIPDANFKNYLVGNTAINTNGDTEIQCSEATAFTGSINCPNLNISDLTAIEAFTNITELYCNNNPLTSLDVSQNTALTRLYCYNNSLTSLDVSQNTALIRLYCYSNSLTSLDVSQNTALIRLYCNYNSLNALDISQNTALTIIYCNDNSLTSLDVSQNTALTHIYSENNSLSNLDVSQNTALTQLYCNNNSLTSLNVANGSNSNVDFMFAQNNPNLTCIQHDAGFTPPTNNSWRKDATASWSDNCSTTPCIVSIPDTNFKNYLVGNTAINTNGDTEIQCSEAASYTGSMILQNLNISDLTGIEAFTSLTFLSCVNNNLMSLDVSQNTALTYLACSGNPIANLDVSQNTALTTLYCNNNNLSSLDISQNTALSIFYCEANPISSIDISNNIALTEVGLGNNQLTGLDTSQNYSLQFLYLTNNQLTNLDVSSNPYFEELDVAQNQLTSLNVANGSNGNFVFVFAQNNPNLTCIQHDTGFDPTTNNNWVKDATASWSDNCGSLSVQDFNEIAISLYPNPVENNLTISLQDALKKVEIYNLQGQKVLESNTVSVDVSKLSAGMYILKVQTTSDKVYVKRFVKV